MANDAKQKNRRRLVILPLAAFLAIGAIFAYALTSGDPSKLPSALIGKPVPEFALPAVDGLLEAGRPVPGFAAKDLRKGKVTIVNVWASWCPPCHKEHPVLVRLAEQSKVPIYGINQKDDPTNARRFLGRYGNPFRAVGSDLRGRVSIDWGVYGLPETFIVDGLGRIVYKHVGPLTPEDVKTRILPAIEKARKRAKSAS